MAGVKWQVSDVRQNFGESRVLKKACYHLSYLLSALFYRGVPAILRDSGWFFRIKFTVRLFYKVQNLKNV